MENNENKSDSKQKKIAIIILAIVMIILAIVIVLFLINKNDVKEEYITVTSTVGIYKDPDVESDVVEMIESGENVKVLSDELVVDKQGNQYRYVQYVNDEGEVIKGYILDEDYPVNENGEGKEKRFEFESDEVSIDVGSETQLKYDTSLLEENLIWESSNDDVITVDKNGKIKALKEGKVTIKVKSSSSNYVLGECEITVNNISVSGITLDKKEVYLNLSTKRNVSLIATIQPANATNKKVEWISSDINVAIVDKNGKVSAVGVGSAKITVISKDSGKSKTAKVRVFENEIDTAISNLEISKESVSLKINDKIKLSYKVSPSKADEPVTWKSSNKDVAGVDSYGNVRAIKEGTTVISVTNSDNSIISKCYVTVKKIKVTDISLNKTTLKLYTNGTKSETLVATIKPSNATYKTVTWKSSDKDVATVNKNGKVTAVKRGVATITATAKDGGKVATCIVYVSMIDKTVNVSDISLNKTTMDLVTNGKNIDTLVATIKPSNASNKQITWSSSNPDVAIVDNLGKVTAIGNGTAIVTAITKSGNKRASATVNVTTSVTNISFDKTFLYLEPGMSEVLTPSIIPLNASNKNIKWTSSDSKVAEVDDEGKVTAIGTGTSIITATTEDGGKSASVSVTCVDDIVEVEAVTLNKTSLDLQVGNKETLVPTIKPANASNKSIKWTSSDSNVAKVDANGVVTGVKNGTAIITVTTEDGGKSASVTVTVTTNVEKITLDKQGLYLELGKSDTLKATIVPPTASNKNILWTSGNKDIATVDETGKVTGMGLGKTVITAKTENGGKSASAEVYVVEKIVPVEKVTINETSLSLVTNGTKTANLTVAISPEDANNKNVKWKSSNTSVATVDENGKVTAIGNGTATITVTTEDGEKSASTKVTVTTDVEGITLNEFSTYLARGKSQTLVPVITPANASDKSVEWKSSDTSIATVDKNGKVTGVKNGPVTITATTKNGGKSASAEIIVVEKIVPVEDITLDKNYVSLVTNGTNTGILTATISPEDANNKNVEWKSSNTNVVTVDESGSLRAVGNGTATVTVTTKDGGKSASADVTVTTSVDGLSLNRTSLFLETNGTRTGTFVATVSPSTASNKKVSWYSSDTSVAIVDENGIVTAVGEGTATITAITDDKGIQKSATVTVTTAVTGLSLNRASLSLVTNGTKTGTLVATVSPSDATNKKVNWHSSNTSVATVDSYGTVTAVGNGTAIITATTDDKGFQKSATVTVTTNPTGISLNKSSLSFIKNSSSKTQTITATVSPLTASNKSVTWSSSNSSIASVNSSGTVTALKRGTATITATTSNGYKATATVVIKEKIVVVIGASQVTRMNWYVTSWTSASNNTYSTSNSNLIFINESGTGIPWQYSTASSEGWARTKTALNTYAADKSNVELHIFFPLSGNTIKDFCCCSECSSDSYNIGDTNSLMKGYALGYNSRIQELKTSGYTVKGYVVSMHALRPGQSTNSKVVMNSNANSCKKDYRSNFKYYRFNSSMKRIVEGSYTSNLEYLSIYTKYIMNASGSTCSDRAHTYRDMDNYNTDDGIHWDASTTRWYVDKMLGDSGDL